MHEYLVVENAGRRRRNELLASGLVDDVARGGVFVDLGLGGQPGACAAPGGGLVVPQGEELAGSTRLVGEAAGSRARRAGLGGGGGGGGAGGRARGLLVRHVL